MSHSEEIRIPFNKFKLIIFLVGSLIFVALGFALLFKEVNSTSTAIRHNSWSRLFGIETVGTGVLSWVTIVFFGLIAISILRQLFFKKEAVIITEEELISNAMGFKTKKIPLHLISNVDLRKHRGGTMIRVEYVVPKWNDPNTFLERVTYINKNSISFNFEKLFEILRKRVNMNR